MKVLYGLALGHAALRRWLLLPGLVVLVTFVVTLAV